MTSWVGSVRISGNLRCLGILGSLVLSPALWALGDQEHSGWEQENTWEPGAPWSSGPGLLGNSQTLEMRGTQAVVQCPSPRWLCVQVPSWFLDVLGSGLLGPQSTTPPSLACGSQVPVNLDVLWQSVSPLSDAPSHPPPTRFYINLLCGDEPDSETVLHFNPRLDESSVVFNSLECGAWGSEERGLSIPFQRGHPFYLLLIASRKGFKVRLCHRGGRQHPGLFPWQGQEGPCGGGEQRRGQGWAGRPQSLTSRGASALRAGVWRWQGRESKSPKGGCLAGRRGHSGPYSLSTGV